MKKSISFFVAFTMFFLSVFLFKGHFSATGAESATEENASFIVVIQHDYSVTKPNYVPAMFSDLYIKRVEPIMIYDDTENPGSLYNKDIFQDILVLVVNEIGMRNMDAVEELLAELPFVVSVSRDSMFEPELGKPHETGTLEDLFIPDLEAPPGNGDIDFDGNITVKDARLALRISLSLECDMCPGTNHYYAADVNGDGEVHTDDARNILRKALGLQSGDGRPLQNSPHE